MRQGTSGVWVNEKENCIQIGYEDYNVSEFGGSDFECTYTLSNENAEKFREKLKESYSGSTEEMVKKAFGENFNDSVFTKFCKENGIEYSMFTWTSGGDYDNAY